MAHGDIGWIEIPVTSIDKVRGFYAELFGWTYQESPGDTPYLMFSSGDTQIGGLDATGQPGVGQDGLRIYVSVDDLEAVCAKAPELGGSVEQGRTDIGGDMGYFAFLRDPEGNRIGAWSLT
jgi:predicted enzyme related to lactoylglutathione lyase